MTTRYSDWTRSINLNPESIPGSVCFFQLYKAKAKVLLPITTNVNNEINQSELEANTRKSRARARHASVLKWLIVSFNRSHDIGTQNLSKRAGLFSTLRLIIIQAFNVVTPTYYLIYDQQGFPFSQKFWNTNGTGRSNGNFFGTTRDLRRYSSFFRSNWSEQKLPVSFAKNVPFPPGCPLTYAIIVPTGNFLSYQWDCE